MQMSVAVQGRMGPMTLWKPQNRSGDLLGPNCLRGPLFSFAVKQLYTGHALAIASLPSRAIQLYIAIQRYTALYIIQLYIANTNTTSTAPLWLTV